MGPYLVGFLPAFWEGIWLVCHSLWHRFALCQKPGMFKLLNEFIFTRRDAFPKCQPVQGKSSPAWRKEKKWKRNYCSARSASSRVDSRLSEDLIPRKACLFKEIETEPAVILTRTPGKHFLKNNEKGCGRGTSVPSCSQAGQRRKAKETLSLAGLICTESLLKSQLTPHIKLKLQ